MEAVLLELRALSTDVDRLDEAAAQRFGLNNTDLRALDIIDRQGGASPTNLAKALGLTTGGVTTVIDRLEAAGYAHRHPDGGDRRRRVVVAAPRTGKAREAVFGGLMGAVRELAASFSDQDLAAIHDFLGRHREILNAHSDRLLASRPRPVPSGGVGDTRTASGGGRNASKSGPEAQVGAQR